MKASPSREPCPLLDWSPPDRGRRQGLAALSLSMVLTALGVATPRPAQAALELARANLQRDTAQLKNASIQYDREQKIYAQKLVSQDEFDTSQAAITR